MARVLELIRVAMEILPKVVGIELYEELDPKTRFPQFLLVSTLYVVLRPK